MRLLKNNKGFNLIEVVIASTILVVVVVVLMHIQGFMSRQTVNIKDKTFATQKLIQMTEELRALVSGSENAEIAVLDDYDDGALYRSVLTTDKSVADPAAPLSGNVTMGGGWRYLRQISVIKLPEEPFARKVYVRICRASRSNPNTSDEILAETMTVLKTIKSKYLPTQGMDVYILAMENIPGWWSSLSTLRPMFEAIIQDLQTRNPGLEIRTHWITRLAYGRDLQYVPYINKTSYTNDTAMPLVYFYPGLMRKPADNGDYFYYDPDIMQGKINVQGAMTNSSGYVMADMYNHAVRYPDEETLYNAAAAQADAAGRPRPEITLRMLLEKMNSSPADYKNALIVNLHGELLPVPPMRNYSDAAKDPVDFPNRRIVAHPENLYYASGSAVKLRVYPYVTDLSLQANTELSTATIFFPYDNIPSYNISVEKITGNDTVAYNKSTVSSSSYTYTVTNSTFNSTLITIYHTPMRHPLNGNKGLKSPDNLLYGLEYIPCAVHPSGAPAFTYELQENNKNIPKNTARWIITFSAGALTDGMHVFETRIGTDTSSGTIGNKPANLSRSYVWIGVSPPVTEQYQFMGDPRHCPYLDVKADNRFNWYFRQVAASTGYQGYNKTADGWGDDTLDVDIPRFMQIYRQGLLKTQAIWSAMNGWSYYYYGIGGEFGSDIEPMPNSIPFIQSPWCGNSCSSAQRSAAVSVDEIINYNATLTKSRLVAKSDNSWYSKYWMGELYPDVAYSTWSAVGNLYTGAGQFYRANYGAIGDIGRDRTRRAGSKGCASFFNGGSGSSKVLNHTSGNYTGALTAVGTSLSAMYNFPLLASITAPRPFTLAGTDTPPEWNDSIYNAMRTTLSVPQISGVSRIYYESSYSPSSYDASAVVKMVCGSDTAYVVVSGLGTQSNFGTAPMGKFVLLSMMRTMLESGLLSGQDKISQIPRVEITSPTIADSFVNPSVVNIRWNATWKRWDGQSYTENYPSDYSETTQLAYSVKYSDDNARTWKYCSDNTAAEADKRDSSHFIYFTAYDWNVDLRPRGSYIIRVECYRNNINLHDSYDQLQVYFFK